MKTCKQALSTGSTCPNRARRRGLCDGHYHRLYRLKQGIESRYPMDAPVQGKGGGRWQGDVEVKVVGSRVALAAVAVIKAEAKRRKKTQYELVGDIIENWAKKHSTVGTAA